MGKLFNILNLAIAVLCALLILNHVINRSIFPVTAKVTAVDLRKDTKTGSWNLTIGLENLTDRLITPTILIRFRNQKPKKFAPDSLPLHREEIKPNLFPKEKRSIERRIDLAPGVEEQIESMQVRQKRWYDF